MVVRLTELYKTKYFYLTTGKDLTYLFSTCATLRSTPDAAVNAGSAEIEQVFRCFRTGAPVTFDLAGARFTSDVTPILLNAQRSYGLDLIDSEQSWRNDILKENKRRFELYGNGVQNTIELPLLRQDEKALDFIRNLKKGVLYSVPVTYVHEIWIPLCVLISVFRPSIQLYLNGREAKLLEFVASRLTLNDLNKYREFYMVTKQGVQIVSTDRNFYVQQLGYCDLEQAQSVASFVPTDFGKVVLKDQLEFRTIANECIRTLNKYRNTRPVTLAELFE
ncbi:MAG: hypothetical protein NC548_30750 [Lachnospiraceae bacterium]|nr:hypothetical protein [Lachnospiraceae bacterium]